MTLRYCCSESVIRRVEPLVFSMGVAKFQASESHSPRLHLLWTEEKTSVLVDQLESGTLDAMLLAKEAHLGDVDMEVIAHDRFLLAAARTHPLVRARRPVRVSELRGEDVLLLEDGHCFRDQALAICSRAKAHELEFRATSLTTLVQMVAAGGAVTLLPELAVSVEGRGLELRKFAEDAPHRTIVLAWRKSSPLSNALRKIGATIRMSSRALARELGGRARPSTRVPR